MPWGRYESAFTRHPKVQRIDRADRAGAVGLHLAATLYSAELLTDGFVPEDVLPRLAGEVGIDDTDTIVSKLVKVGLFDKTRGGIVVHDYLEYNPSADEVKAKRKQATERQHRSRVSRRDKPRDNQRDNQRDKTRDCHAVTDSVTLADARVPSPNPTPEPKSTTDVHLKAEGLKPLPIEKQHALHHLLTIIGDHADQGHNGHPATITQLTALAKRLPLAALHKVAETTAGTTVHNRAAYAIAALQDEFAAKAARAAVDEFAGEPVVIEPAVVTPEAGS